MSKISVLRRNLKIKIKKLCSFILKYSLSLLTLVSCSLLILANSNNWIDQILTGGSLVSALFLTALIIFITLISSYSFKESFYSNLVTSLFIIFGSILVIAPIKTQYDSSTGIYIGHAIERSSNKDAFYKAIKTKDKFIFAEGSNCSTYKIEIKDIDKGALHRQEFEKMSYTRNSSDDSVAWREMCNNIISTQRGTPFSEVSSEIQGSRYVQALHNLFAALFEERINGSRIRIYLKGYADTENQQWTRNLLSEYWYSSVPYYKATDLFKTIYHIDDANKRNHAIPSMEDAAYGTYSNEDLPFLRSMFVYEQYFKHFLQGCLGESSGGGILEGEVFSNRDSSKRTTEVYVAVCPEEKTK